MQTEDPVYTGQTVMQATLTSPIFRLLKHLGSVESVDMETAVAIVGQTPIEVHIVLVAFSRLKVFALDAKQKNVSVGEFGRQIVELARQIGNYSNQPADQPHDPVFSFNHRGTP